MHDDTPQDAPQARPQDTPPRRHRRLWWWTLPAAAVVLVLSLVATHPWSTPSHPGPSTAAQGMPVPPPTSSVPDTPDAVVTATPSVASADLAGWIAGSRLILDEYTGNDAGMLSLGVLVCQNMPMTPERAAVIAATPLVSPGPPVTAGEYMSLADLAEQTLCPGGIMLTEPTIAPSSVAPAPSPLVPTPTAKCPTIPQMKPLFNIVGTKPAADGSGRIVIVDLTLTNPRPYPVYLSGDLSGGGVAYPLFPIDTARAYGDVPLPSGSTTTVRTELTYFGGTPNSIQWVFWAVSGSESVSQNAACEQTSEQTSSSDN